MNKSSTAVESSTAGRDSTNNLLKEISGEEDREVGAVTWKVFHTYVMTIGGYKFIFFLLLSAFVYQGLTMYASNFLEDWGKDFEHSPKYTNLEIYGAIWLLASVAGITREGIQYILCYLLSIKMHNKMIRSLLHAELENFLDKVPYGQIQNRFSKDLSLIDKQGLKYFAYWLDSLARTIVLFVTISYSVGYEVIISLIIWIIFAFIIQDNYMNARREYKRLVAICKSPMIDCAADTLKGLVYL